MGRDFCYWGSAGAEGMADYVIRTIPKYVCLSHRTPRNRKDKDYSRCAPIPARITGPTYSATELDLCFPCGCIIGIQTYDREAAGWTA